MSWQQRGHLPAARRNHLDRLADLVAAPVHDLPVNSGRQPLDVFLADRRNDVSGEHHGRSFLRTASTAARKSRVPVFRMYSSACCFVRRPRLTASLRGWFRLMFFAPKNSGAPMQ
jgi:hypothetical protein